MKTLMFLRMFIYIEMANIKRQLLYVQNVMSGIKFPLDKRTGKLDSERKKRESLKENQ
jgi:hypothetical protein